MCRKFKSSVIVGIGADKVGIEVEVEIDSFQGHVGEIEVELEVEQLIIPATVITLDTSPSTLPPERHTG